jgi:hypothetical protein
MYPKIATNVVMISNTTKTTAIDAPRFERSSSSMEKVATTGVV